MNNILETKKHSKACINVAVIASGDNISPKELEEEKPQLSHVTTAPTFSQKHLKHYEIIASNRENFSTA